MYPQLFQSSDASPERFRYVVVSHGGIILLWQKPSLDEIHNGMKSYLVEISYVFAPVKHYCNSRFLNGHKNLKKSPSWFNIYLVRFKSSQWFHRKVLAFLENFNDIKTFRNREKISWKLHCKEIGNRKYSTPLCINPFLLLTSFQKILNSTQQLSVYSTIGYLIYQCNIESKARVKKFAKNCLIFIKLTGTL